NRIILAGSESIRREATGPNGTLVHCLPMRAGLGWYLNRFYRVGRRYSVRKARQIRGWLENTSHLERLSVLVFLPALIAGVTILSNSVAYLSFLLFPPLASGTYTLFSNPESQYAHPVKFVGGMTIGAFIGWASLEFVQVFGLHIGARTVEVTAGSAALGLFMTGVFTWILDLEEPTAFSTTLLVLITGTSQFAYVVSVAVSSTIVAIVFVAWREHIYEERARYLYSTTGADDHVLVPMLTEHALSGARFGAEIAAAHEAGKVVLLELVDEQAIAAAERDILEREETDSPLGRAEYIAEAQSAAEERAADWAARTLEQQAADIESKLGVPCEVIVAVDEDDTAQTVLDAAERSDCDLVVAPFEYEDGGIPDYVRNLFTAALDVVAFRGSGGRASWQRPLVAIEGPGELANAMMDYADRLAGDTGTVSSFTCIDQERRRREAERRLADIVETCDATCETRVANASVVDFLERNASHHDVVFLGASTDRSAPSRLFRSPTYEVATDLDTDLAVVHHA
ncbi:MAG: HPP family protein, partial [Halodesulfurarchaeum sp.]